MAFFDPGTNGTQPVDPTTFDNIRSQWDEFLGNPQGRAALLSAGLALMQPPSFGDTPVAQIGRAIGSAGQSATANQIMDLKTREAESKDADRETRAAARLTQADAAVARADAAQTRANAAGDRLSYQGQRLQDMQERANLQGRLRAVIGYQNYLKNEAQAKLLDPNRPPPMARDDWMRSMGLGDIMVPAKGASAAPTGEEEDIPPVASTTSAPEAPPNASDRKANTIYNTPKGPLRWTGTGWVKP